jgi:hypothetical protein
MNMTINLTHQESEEIFFNALCNGAAFIEGYGIEITTEEADYKEAKNKLKMQNELPCYEDVLMQVLRDGKCLYMVDHEEGIFNASITLNDIHERVKSTPIKHLLDMVNEQDDADTADIILQHTFYQDIIFA